MEAKKATILDFIGSQATQFVIPVYQRNYAWTEEQCSQLWDDMIRAGHNDDIKMHFIGTIVAIENGLHSVGFHSWLVIDGQQRITTISLILEALARAIGGNEIENFDADKIRSYYLKNPQEKELKYHKLILSDSDNTSLHNILNGKDNKDVERNRITANFDFFCNKMAENINDLELVLKGIKKLSVVSIVLTKGEDNPQLIFESMNSTGLSLTKADLIRNFILMDLDSETQKEMYYDFWRPIERHFSNSPNGQEFDEFVRNYLTIKQLSIPKVDEVYEVFKRFSAESKMTTKEIVEDLKLHADYYAEITSTKLPHEHDLAITIKPVLVNMIQKMKNKIILPTVFKLYSDYCNTINTDNPLMTLEELKTSLELLESYYLRRFFAGIGAGNTNIGLLDLMQKIDNENYFESFQKELCTKSNRSRVFPSDIEFTNSFMNKEIYNSASIVKYVLTRLEEYGRKTTINSKNSTIEHVMPQNPVMPQEWQTMIGADWEKVKETYQHTIGNLTLTDYNSEYSDKPYNDKRYLTNKLGVTVGLANSSQYSTLNQDFVMSNVWNESTIIVRAARLAELAKKIWHRPAVKPEKDSSNKSENSRVTIAMLIESSILSPCDIVSTSDLYPATAKILEDGNIEFDGIIYNNPSASGVNAIRKIRPEHMSVNGWDYWGIMQNDGTIRSIGSYRDEY